MKFLNILGSIALLAWLGSGLALGQRRSDVRGVDIDALVELAKTPALEFPKTSITEREWGARLEAWMNKKYGEALAAELAEVGVPNAAGEAPKIIRWWINVGAFSGEDELSARIRAAVPAKAKAPITQFFAGVMAYRTRERAESRARARMCIQETQPGRGSPLLAALSASRLSVEVFQKNAKDEERCVELVREALETENFVEEDADFVVHLLSQRFYEEARRPLAARLLAVFESSALPDWARLQLTGMAHSDAAFTGSETQEARDEHLRAARKALVRSWELRPERPEAATEMISVVDRERYYFKSTEEPRVWFDRAVAANLDYPPAYRAIIYSLSRWWGRTDEVIKLGVGCAKAQRGDTTLPERFFDAMEEIASNTSRSLLLRPEFATLALATRRDRLDFALKEKDARLTEVARAYLACTALLVGDRSTALEQFDLLKDASGQPVVSHLVHEWMCKRGLDWFRAMQEARLLASPAKEAWERAMKARDAREFAGALAALDEAARLAPAQQAWLESWKTTLTFQREFAADTEWHALPKNAAAWQQNRGRWAWRNEGAVEGRSTDRQMPTLIFRPELGEHYELRGNYTLEQRVKDSSYIFGVVVGYNAARSAEFQSAPVLVFEAGPDQVRAATGTDRTSAKQHHGTTGLRPTNSFRIVREGNLLSAWLNDKQLVENHSLPASTVAGEGALGLQTLLLNQSEAIVVSDLEVRRIGEK